VNLPIEVYAKTLRRQIVEQWFERVEVVVAEEGQDRGFPGAAHCAQIVGQSREEFALAIESAVLGQQITCDQDEAGPLLFDNSNQVTPLGDMLVQVAGDNEPCRHWCLMILPVNTLKDD